MFYNDNGLLINIKDDNNGDICPTIDGILCINPNNVGIRINTTYCFTYDRYSCYSNYGPNCDLKTGFNCAKIDGINFSNLSYCISTNNQTCY